MKGKVKRFLALILTCCLVISSLQVSSYAQINSDEDTQNVVALEESGTLTEDAAEEEEAEESSEEEDASDASAANGQTVEASAADEQTEEESDDAEEDALEEEVSAADEQTEEAADDAEEDASAEEEASAEDDAEEASAGKNLTVGLTAAAVESAEDEETAEMPAVTLAKKIGDITVTVEAPEGAFAEGVKMTVEAAEGTDAEEFLDAVAEQDFSQYDETYTVIDAAIQEISFYVDGEEVQPEKNVTVTISGLDLATEDEDGLEADYALIYHMDDEGNVEYVEADQNEEVGLDTYSFTTSDFSAYGIVNVDVEYGVTAAAATSHSFTYYYRSNGSYYSSEQTVYIHFLLEDGTDITDSASITGSYSNTTTNATVALADVADAYEVTYNGTTYYYYAGSSRIATSLTTTYDNAIYATHFGYYQGRNSSYWRYSTNGSNYSNLSGAVTDIYLVYTDDAASAYDDEYVYHIDIEVNTSVTLTIDGVEYSAEKIVLTKDDFVNNVTVIARWNGVYYDMDDGFLNMIHRTLKAVQM